MISSELVVVAGGGGFIGGHLVNRLVDNGYRVRAADHRGLEDWYQLSDEAENLVLDLRLAEACDQALGSQAQQ